MIAVIDPNQQGKYKSFYLFAENDQEVEVLKTISFLLPAWMNDDFRVEYGGKEKQGGPYLQFFKWKRS